MKMNSILIDSFITYVKNLMFKFNAKLVLERDYKDEEIMKINKVILTNDLISIYENIGKSSNNFRIFLDNNHLKIEKTKGKKIIKLKGRRTNKMM